MSLIGGLVFWGRAQPVTVSHLRAMAGPVAGEPLPLCVAEGSVGLFSSGRLKAIHSTEQVWAVGDLDLTNLEELRALTGLQRKSGALLPALYALEGPGFVRRLRGAFALALWDRRQQILLLAVDRFGIKRLHYASDHRKTAFGSRQSALLEAPELEPRVDLTAVYHYLNFGFVPAPGSIFAGLRRLPPGHLLVVRDGHARLEQFWDMTYPEQPIREREAAASLCHLTEEAVAETIQGGSPKETGAFLSGGTDSSTVVGLLGRLTGERVNAFSIGFREDRYNELDYAELAARHFGAAHYTRIVTAEEAFESLPRLVEAFDEPFGNSSAIGTFFCARLARECGVSRLLAGDGGDEIFGGNERYRTDRLFALYHRIPALVRRRVLEPILLHLPEDTSGLLGRARNYIRRANLPNPRRFYSYGFLFAQEAPRLLAPEFLEAVDPDAPWTLIQEHFDRARAISELNRLLYIDVKLTIGDNDLLKVTRTAELAGVGVRFPLLDPRLVEFTGTLPASFKVRELEKRYLFKRAFRTLLPPQTLAKQKHGFGVPTSLWLKGHPGFQALARETLLSSRARQRGYFRSGAVEGLFERHAHDTTPFYGDILWTVLMLELWHQQHLDGRKAA